VDSDDAYKGVPLGSIQIESISWSDEAIEHITTRRDRKIGDETNMQPEWATEAALDDDRVVRVAGDNDNTSSLKIIGWSPSACGDGRLLKVWIWSDDPSSHRWDGASACLANDSDAKKYTQRREQGRHE